MDFRFGALQTGLERDGLLLRAFFLLILLAFFLLI
jgi:hypothetical protein